MVTDNYKAVDRRVREAAARAGRDRDEIVLIAVSKTKPVELVLELTEAGVRDFGENHAQELVQKYEVIHEGIRWHFIGHLQRNKVKYVVGRACLIHSVSSLRLAEEINKESLKKGVVSDILMEVNIADEETKSGISDEEAETLLRQISELPALRVKGLMAIAPPVDDPEENRGYFRQMRALRDKFNTLGLPNVDLKELSMGMTGDFEVAIEEGATMVRVGTAIFGERHYD